MKRGSVAVLILPILLFMTGVLFWTIDGGRALYLNQKLESVAASAALSSMRVRAEALGDVAGRWNEFGSFFGAVDASGVSVPSSQWSDVVAKADQLQRALGGYKGRIKAVIKPVAEANGLNPEYVNVIDDKGSDLGISAQSEWIHDESGRRQFIKGAWYKREWAPSQRLALRDASSVFEAAGGVPVLAPLFFSGRKAWSGKRRALVRLAWDVDANNNPVAVAGNGGFPRSWTEALNGGTLDPHRFPFFRAEEE